MAIIKMSVTVSITSVRTPPLISVWATLMSFRTREPMLPAGRQHRLARPERHQRRPDTDQRWRPDTGDGYGHAHFYDRHPVPPGVAPDARVADCDAGLRDDAAAPQPPHP